MQSILPFAVVLIGSSTCFAQIADEPDMTTAERQSRLRSFARRELTLELVRIGDLTELSGAQRRELNEVGTPAAIRVGTARAEDQRVPTFILRNFSGDEVRDALAKELARTHGEDVARKYEGDFRQRVAFFDKAYGDMLLTMLDQQVNLSQDQVAEARKEIENLQSFRYTHPHIHYYDWTWGIAPPPEFVAHQFKCLSAKQTQLWSKRSELLKPVLENLRDSTSSQIAAVIGPRCQIAMGLKVDILAEQLNLTKAQTEKLRLLAKRVKKDLSEKLPKAHKLRETSMVKPNGEWSTPLNQRIPILELIQLTDLFDLIECRTDWRKWVRSVLNEDQLNIYDARHRQRVTHNHQAQWRCWVVCYSLRLGLTAEKEAALFKLLTTSIRPDPTATRLSHTGYYQPGAIPLAAYIKAIGKRDTADLDARVLGSLRAALAEDKPKGEE